MLSLACLVVGNMIGVSVYVNGFYSMQSLRDARLVLILWFVGGVHAICGAVAYGAVVNRLPISGGEYTFLSRCVHPVVGFIAGWISIIAGFAAPIALSAQLIGKYVTADGVPEEQCKWIATGSIVLGALLMGTHLKVGSWFNNGVIVVKLVCFSIFLSIGIPFVLQGTNTGLLVDVSTDAPNAIDLTTRMLQPDTMNAMLVQLFYVALAYTGFNASIYIAGEIDGKELANGKRRYLVSRSMLIACTVVMVIYVLLNWVFLYAVDPQLIVASGERYVTTVAESLGGPKMASMMRIAIILSVLTSVLAMMAVGPMVYAQMADDGRLPAVFRLNGGVPRFAIAVQTVLSCSIVWLSNMNTIIGYLGLTLTACGALAVSSIWFAKANFIDKNPVQWYEHIATLVYIAGALLFLVAAYCEPRARMQFWLCIGTFGSGALVYLVYRLSKKSESHR